MAYWSDGPYWSGGRSFGLRPLSEQIRLAYHLKQRRVQGFGAYEQKHQEILGKESEDECMREGSHGVLNTFLVGCDPEFVALNGSGQQMNLSAHLRPDGEIGYDHGGRVGELRPEATRGTYALTKRLQRLIRSNVIEGMKAAKLRAGARVNRDTLGGHVHLGIPVPRGGVPGIVAALDRVTAVLEALDILPASESRTRRETGAYGGFGD